MAIVPLHREADLPVGRLNEAFTTIGGEEYVLAIDPERAMAARHLVNRFGLLSGDPQIKDLVPEFAGNQSTSSRAIPTGDADPSPFNTNPRHQNLYIEVQQTDFRHDLQPMQRHFHLQEDINREVRKVHAQAVADHEVPRRVGRKSKLFATVGAAAALGAGILIGVNTERPIAAVVGAGVPLAAGFGGYGAMQSRRYQEQAKQKWVQNHMYRPNLGLVKDGTDVFETPIVYLRKKSPEPTN